MLLTEREPGVADIFDDFLCFFWMFVPDDRYRTIALLIIMCAISYVETTYFRLLAVYFVRTLQNSVLQNNANLLRTAGPMPRNISKTTINRPQWHFCLVFNTIQ